MTIDSVKKSNAPQYKKIAILKILLELQKRSKEPLNTFVPHAGQKKIFDCDWRNKKLLVVLGGNRSGKTHVGAIIAAQLALGMFKGQWKPAPLKIWLVALSFDMAEKILWEEKLKSIIPSRLIAKSPSFASNGDKCITFVNGSTIEFKSCEQGVDKFQGASVDYIQFDEEPPAQIYKECVARTVDCGGKILFTMTPTNGFSWSYNELYAASKENDKIKIFNMSTYDNKDNIKADEMVQLEELYSDDEKKMRLYGDFINIGDRNIFEHSVLEKIYDTIDAGLEPFKAEISYDYPIEDQNGGLSIWEQPMHNAHYIVSADTSEGATKLGDPSGFSVFKLEEDGIRQVAEYNRKFSLEEIKPIFLSLLRLYNNAFAIIEKQSAGIMLISYLIAEGYSNIYTQTKMDASYRDGQLVQSYGFYTGAQSKRELISTTIEMIKNGRVKIQSHKLWQQMQFYIEKVTKSGVHKITASNGHDDLVICLMLACEAYKSEQWKYFAPVNKQENIKRIGYGKKTQLQQFASL